ncbi:hypothetical protein CFRS1_v015718 [Colletotrichum fructicola]|nr:hypothetical protein CFRS1_v015718 [Colletotrichum fructicola]
MPCTNKLHHFIAFAASDQGLDVPVDQSMLQTLACDFFSSSPSVIPGSHRTVSLWYVVFIGFGVWKAFVRIITGVFGKVVAVHIAFVLAPDFSHWGRS